MPRRKESKSRKSKSVNKTSEVQNPRRKNMAGAQSGTDQAQIVMKKFLKEIRGMFSELKNEVWGINEKFSDIISELRTDIDEIISDVAGVNKKVQDTERQVGEKTKGLGYHVDKVEEIEKQLDEHCVQLVSLMEVKIEMMNRK